MSLSKSIPEAPNRQPVSLKEEVAEHIDIGIVQGAEPRIVIIVIRWTPQVTGLANEAVTTIAVAETARKTSK